MARRAQGDGGQTCSLVSVKSFGALGDGVTDDAAAFQAAVNAVSGTGTALHISPAVYVIGSPIILPSNLVIEGSSGAVLQSLMGAGAPGVDSSIVRSVFLVPDPAIVSSTTLATDTTAGSTNVSVSAPVPVGSTISITSAAAANRRAVYVVTVGSGASPYVLTLDRPVLMPFAANDCVAVLASRATSIAIRGNGMLITGTGDRAIEIRAGLNCVVQDVCVDTSGGALGDIACSFDLGSYGCRWVRMRINGGGVIPYGLALESAEACNIEHCTVQACGSDAGIVLFDCAECSVIDSQAKGNGGNGLALTADGNTTGCIDCTVSGGDFSGNASSNIAISLGSSGAKLVGVTANNSSSNGGAGLILSPKGGTISNTVVTGCQFNGNTNNGITIGTGSTATSISDTDTSENGNAGINTSADTALSNWNALDNGVGAMYAGSGQGCQVTVTGYVLRGSAPNWAGMTLGVNVRAYLHSGRMELNGDNSQGVIVGAYATLVTTGTVFKGSGSGCTAVYMNPGGTFRQGTAFDGDALECPVAVNGGYWSHGTVVANGTTPVFIPWPDAKTTDVLRLTPAVAEANGLPTYTVIAGIGFSFSSYAGDSGTWNWSVT